MNEQNDDGESETEVALRRLWARPDAPRRGPKPRLSVERIVDTAFALADAEGLGALSMARLGEELGVTAMALYRHVSGKDEVLVLLADRVGAALEPLPDGLDWRTGLEIWVRRQIDAALAHPWLLDLPLASVPVGPHRLRWLDQGFKVMRPLRIGGAEKLRLLGLLAQHVLGEARVQAEARTSAEDPWVDLQAVLDHHARPGDVPDLRAALRAPAGEGSALMPTAGDLEAEVDFGIRVVLDGVEADLRRRGAVGE